MLNDTATTDSQRLMIDLLTCVHPLTWIDVRTAAVLTGVSEDEAATTLGYLVRAGMLQHRYALHDPGQHPGHRSLTPQQRRVAYERLIEGMLRMSAAAQLAIAAAHPYLSAHLQQPPTFAFTLVDAIAWLDSAHPILVAVQRRAADLEMHQAVWELAESCSGLFRWRKRYASWDVMYRLGLDAAIASGDLSAQARMRIGLAQLHIELNEPNQAVEHARTALDLENTSGSLPGQALAMECFGDTMLALGSHDEARDLYAIVRRLYEQLAQPRAVALTKRREGQARLAAGTIDTARELISHALDYFVEAHEPYEEGQALLARAQVHLAEQNAEAAELAAENALAISRTLGTPADQRAAILILAEAADQQGNPGVANQYRQCASHIEDLLREERLAVRVPATR